MAVRTFDPSDMRITWGGVPISGYAPEFLSAAHDLPTFRLVQGIDGRTTRIRNKLTGGRISVTLSMGSRSNADLSAALLLDQETGLGSLPFVAHDEKYTNLIFAPFAFIETFPPLDYSNEAVDRTWVFATPNLIMYCGGLKNASNSVGQAFFPTTGDEANNFRSTPFRTREPNPKKKKKKQGRGQPV